MLHRLLYVPGPVHGCSDFLQLFVPAASEAVYQTQEIQPHLLAPLSLHDVVRNRCIRVQRYCLAFSSQPGDSVPAWLSVVAGRVALVKSQAYPVQRSGLAHVRFPGGRLLSRFRQPSASVGLLAAVRRSVGRHAAAADLLHEI